MSQMKFEFTGTIGNTTVLENVVFISAASNYEVKNEKGKTEQRTQWHKLAVFSTNGVRVQATRLQKGDLVKFEGYISPEQGHKNESGVYQMDRPMTAVATMIEVVAVAKPKA